MGYKYFLPLDYDSVYKNSNAKPFTYDYRPTGGPRHDPGKLDMALDYNGVDIFSMTEGTVVGVGDYGDDPVDPTTYCHILADNKIMGHQAYFRYLHGNFDETLKNKHISRGLKIGTVNTHGAGGYHLHVDIMPDLNHLYSPNGEFMGTLDFEHRTFTFEGTTYLLDSNIDLNWIKTWNLQRSDPAENTDIGYCWLIFALEPLHLTPSPTPSGDSIPLISEYYEESPETISSYGSQLVDAYYNKTLSTNFCGIKPSSWEEFESEQCLGLRCIVDFVKHEVGGWTIGSAVYAKLLRANMLGALWMSSTPAAQLARNIYSWLEAITTAHPGFIGPMEGWVDGLYIYNNGQGCLNLSSNLYVELTDENLKWVQAVYDNFVLPEIYGMDLNDIYKNQTDYINAIIKFASMVPTMNGQYWSTIQDAIAFVLYDPYNDTTYTRDLTAGWSVKLYLNKYLGYRLNGNLDYCNTIPFGE